MKFKLLAAVFAAAFAATGTAGAQVTAGTSAYATRLDDPRAVYLTGAKADGKADDTAAIQTAIDKASQDRGEGIVFIPSGRYRITHTIYVWPAVRVIGWGEKRPVFVLGDHTPGFQKGIGAMVFFAGFRPGAFAARPGRPAFKVPFPPPDSVPPNDKIGDANPGTFYSALSNIDSEIGKENAFVTSARSSFMSARIIGSTDTVGRRLIEMLDYCNLDGVMLIFPDYVKSMPVFGREILLKLRARYPERTQLAHAG